MIRVGNTDYARQNKSYGLTTLLDRHVTIEGAKLRFYFKGKSGKTWRLQVQDRRIARIVKECQDIPGQTLFQYLDDDGARQSIGSSDVNAYLKEATGADITAKDFRTWAGTVLAAKALGALEAAQTQAQARRNLNRAVEAVAAVLGNTPTICRKCYIHPQVLEACVSGALHIEEGPAPDDPCALRPEEAAVLAFLDAAAKPRRSRRRAA